MHKYINTYIHGHKHTQTRKSTPHSYATTDRPGLFPDGRYSGLPVFGDTGGRNNDLDAETGSGLGGKPVDGNGDGTCSPLSGDVTGERGGRPEAKGGEGVCPDSLGETMLLRGWLNSDMGT